MTWATILKGQKTRAKIVELCRTDKEIKELAITLDLYLSGIRRHIKSLIKEGWIQRDKQKGTPTIFRTIREDKYPITEFVRKKKPWKKKIDPPGVHTYKMEDFRHRPYELRKVEHRGIGSTFGRFDTV
jgi:hypothetical protein